MAGLKQKEIDSLGKWYQTIDFGKYGKSKGSAKDLDKKWELVKKELPFSLEDKSILDLGCNAGYFDFKIVREEHPKYIICVEGNQIFQKQFMFSLCTLSVLYGFVQSQYMRLEKVDANNFDFDTIPKYLMNSDGKYDITFAFNFFYWLTYSDEEGSIENPEDVLLGFLKKLSFHTEYLLIIGAEGVFKDRERKGLNSLGTSLDRTLPFLQPYFDICKHQIINSGSKKASNIILCKAKEH